MQEPQARRSTVGKRIIQTGGVEATDSKPPHPQPPTTPFRLQAPLLQAKI